MAEAASLSVADAAPRGERHAAVPSIFIFIAADTASFVLFFAVFMAERLHQVALFSRSARLLDARLGLLNTLILITSGWFVALALAAIRSGRTKLARVRLMLALVVGSIFGIVKIIEYAGKIWHGLTPTTNEFFTFYYILTGVHFLHYLIGMALLLFLLGKVREPADEQTQFLWFTPIAGYWHMVDLLWVFLFPMLYLQGGA